MGTRNPPYEHWTWVSPENIMRFECAACVFLIRERATGVCFCTDNHSYTPIAVCPFRRTTIEQKKRDKEVRRTWKWFRDFNN